MIDIRRALARLAQGLVVVFVSTSIAFVLLKAAPGDQFTGSIEHGGVTAEVIAAQRESAGLNKPLLEQYAIYVAGVARGDLGMSTRYPGRTVASLIGEMIPQTLLLMALAFTFSVSGGITLGAWQGSRTNPRTRRAVDRLTLTIISMPDFWVGTALILLFALRLHWFPTAQMDEALVGQSLAAKLVNRAHHLVLPVLALTLVNASIFARFQNASMRDVMHQQFLNTARAKGVAERDVIRSHALRLAVLPQITLAGMYFPALLVGTILIERVFAWPGMGALLTNAVTQRDLPLVTGIVIVGSAMTAIGSFLADLTRETLDPRLRSS